MLGEVSPEVRVAHIRSKVGLWGFWVARLDIAPPRPLDNAERAWCLESEPAARFRKVVSAGSDGPGAPVLVVQQQGRSAWKRCSWWTRKKAARRSACLQREQLPGHGDGRSLRPRHCGGSWHLRVSCLQRPVWRPHRHRPKRPRAVSVGLDAGLGRWGTPAARASVGRVCGGPSVRSRGSALCLREEHGGVRMAVSAIPSATSHAVWCARHWKTEGGEGQRPSLSQKTP